MGDVVVPPDGKYRPLFEYLASFSRDRWPTSFADIERILGEPLPEQRT